MIDWKLAEKLKKAGFPQEPTIELGGGCDGQTEKVGFYFSGKPESCGGVGLMNDEQRARKESHGYITIKIPTLEELIEAIRRTDLGSLNGRNFHLEGHYMHDFGYKAEIYILRSIEPAKEETITEWSKESPEEAVALLWLELNKPKEGAKWCSKHKIAYQDYCDECVQEERSAIGRC